MEIRLVVSVDGGEGDKPSRNVEAVAPNQLQDGRRGGGHEEILEESLPDLVLGGDDSQLSAGGGE